MSTKSLTFGLFGGMPKVANETKGPARPPNRSAIALTRPNARAKATKFTPTRYVTKNYFAAGLLAATGIMFILYIFGINQSAAKGYEVTREKNKLNQIVEENKKLLVRTAEVGSIVQIQQEAADNHLVQITNQEYLEVNQLSQR